MNTPHGLIDQSALNRKNDYLFRLSLKALIIDDDGKVLVVKESGRSWWDLPGGGIDHDESIKDAIARELAEEVNLSGEFSYQIIDIEEPYYLQYSNVWQVRLVFMVKPVRMKFSKGIDSDEAVFKDPRVFKSSDNETEQCIYRYVMQTASTP